MATSTTAESSSHPRQDPRPRGRRFARIAVVVVVGLLLLAAGTLIGLRLARAGSLPGVTVDGVDVGGEPPEEVHRKLELLAERKADAVVVARRDDQRYRGVARDLGYSMDVDATAEAVLARGRQANPVTALVDHLRAFSDETPIEPVESVDGDTVQAWADAAAEELELSPREGRLQFDGATVTPVEPREGALVDADELRTRVAEALYSGDGATIDVETEPVEPVTTAEAVAAVLEEARRAVSAPVTLRRGDDEVTLSEEQIAGVLLTRANDDGSIDLEVSTSALTEALGPEAIDRLERDPQSARFEISGRSIELIKGHNGFEYNAEKAAEQLLEVAVGDGDRNVKLAGDIEKAELTNREARDLNIEERVSTFTTYHACCESRVTNIQRIADIVDDVVVEPGETLSVNGFVGERTEEKGFVGGGAIFEGVFVEQIGGGVSQFATTMYNAAYFGGYEIVEHKPHSYYISRYPEGREATLNYPNVDLKIRNNSPHGMVISTSYTDESITVSVYGKKWVEVESVTGPRRNIKEPETEYRENDDLPKGEERVLQEAGGPGFDVTVTRILKFPDGETKREEIFTRYLPQPRIIERNT